MLGCFNKSRTDSVHTGQPLAEVRGYYNLLSSWEAVSGDLSQVVYFPGSFQLNLQLTLFIGQTPSPITGCFTLLIGRWKRGFGFQAWWPQSHAEPRCLASMKMHFKHPKGYKSSPISLRFTDTVIMCMNMNVCVCVCVSVSIGTSNGLSPVRRIPCCALIEFLLW